MSGDALQVVEGLPAETDLVICNLSGLRTHAVELSALRTAQHPRALPLVLLLPRDVALASVGQGERVRVGRAAATLTLLADDLLLVAQGRAHTQLLLERVESDLAEAAERALQMLPHRERASPASTGDTRARVDSLRVVQMLVNLLQNALRHGEATTPVELSVNGTPSGVSLSVSNGGTLDGEHVEELFEAFAQGTTTKEARAGSGLGLYIVRMIAAAHGGQVGVESHDGRVTFTVTLPRD